jgi:hypothetical protein
MLKYLRKTYEVWRADPWLGRLVGGLYPMFVNTRQYFDYVGMVHGSINEGASAVFYFHQDLHLSRALPSKVWPIIAAPNMSQTLGINHAKFLMLLSTLRNRDVGEVEKRRLIANHKAAWRDAIYRAKARAAVQPSKLRHLIA